MRNAPQRTPQNGANISFGLRPLCGDALLQIPSRAQLKHHGPLQGSAVSERILSSEEAQEADDVGMALGGHRQRHLMGQRAVRLRAGLARDLHGRELAGGDASAHVDRRTAPGAQGPLRHLAALAEVRPDGAVDADGVERLEQRAVVAVQDEEPGADVGWIYIYIQVHICSRRGQVSASAVLQRLRLDDARHHGDDEATDIGV
mmetsp:Transcript_164934/g.529408  ORF Transcript_164934/g.529408 Transcript_164934/m.529408 type:complete len:203 (+) Transcript_164934:2600-3208(+)